MTREELRKLLRAFKKGQLTERRIAAHLLHLEAENLPFATVDHHREQRQGFPEVIFCEGKTERQTAEIALRISRQKSVLFATRATPKHYAAVRKLVRGVRYNPVARTISGNEHLVQSRAAGTVLIVTAGTSDIPVAEEAYETCRITGNPTERLFDVGVAGIHRILSQGERLRNASVIIVVAGMEGALPSVVGGLVRVPVIAVPTSIGYGVSFGGVSALLGMLNSCAPGVTVVNIDNGFGAGFAASRMNRVREKQ